MLLNTMYVNGRFLNHSRTVDAVLVERAGPLNCLAAMGSPLIFGKGSNTWVVDFVLEDGSVHRTQLVHHCDVVPPDFGRGRGKMWMQYDVDDPDRTRVLNDDRPGRYIPWQAAGLAVWGAGLVWGYQRRRRPV